MSFTYAFGHALDEQDLEVLVINDVRADVANELGFLVELYHDLVHPHGGVIQGIFGALGLFLSDEIDVCDSIKLSDPCLLSSGALDYGLLDLEALDVSVLSKAVFQLLLGDVNRDPTDKKVRLSRKPLRRLLSFNPNLILFDNSLVGGDLNEFSRELLKFFTVHLKLS